MGVSIMGPLSSLETMGSRLLTADTLAEGAMSVLLAAVADFERAAAMQDTIAEELYAEIRQAERNIRADTKLAQEVEARSILNANTAQGAREFITTITI